MKYFILLLLIFSISKQSNGQAEYVNDQPFWQEYHEGYVIDTAAEANDVKHISVNRQQAWIVTSAGVYMKNNNENSWKKVPVDGNNGPVFTVATDVKGITWIGAWNGVYKFQNNSLQLVPGTNGPISVLSNSNEGLYAIGPDGIWLLSNEHFAKLSYNIPRSVRNAVSDGNNGLWIASDVGLYHCYQQQTVCIRQTDLLLSAYIKDVAVSDDNTLWTAGLGGVSVLEKNSHKRFIRPENGCPSIYVNAIHTSPDGSMWIGTDVGLARFYKDGTHSLLFSRRWLMNDHVNDITFDEEGSAWIATSKGVSVIKRRKMTLADKQEFFYSVLMKRHIREPWIAGQCHLNIEGDVNSWIPEDDDNDGEFTSNYLAMESFRYATTKDPQAKKNAEKAFHFLKLLQEVTGTNGFFARSIVPVDWAGRVHDGNRTYNDQQLAAEQVQEPRFKPVQTRWHRSKDGKWLWKGDTSSDEVCGHMMGYFFYYLLAADDKEKQIISKHVGLLVDHLIANNFCLVDIDGKHTRWGVWSPDRLNNDPEWAPDRSQNSMEMLAFLKLAYYMTNDEKYQQQYLTLINKHGYLENMKNIVHQNPAWFVYFDVVLQAYMYPILLTCEKDSTLHNFYQQHMDEWMDKRRNDQNPLVNFFYCFARNKKEEIKASSDFLINTPLDLIDWTVDHTKREDVQIVRSPVLDDAQVNILPPPSIRYVVRWDKNPWAAVNGYPNMEREPVFWLLPYWMGRYLGMIR
ncbi:hypothetical protein QTN47_06890 [Danxiaibacter flavus]|uniref:Two component regulator propeller n=1 Tax=Danxiaibacter flavus TaxID=3049108 RepID=A0ABV3ZFF6_9BACT|nr:hypothetical protein QNM32_06890 [Chitinophagaceae bacterium DXS]